MILAAVVCTSPSSRYAIEIHLLSTRFPGLLLGICRITLSELVARRFRCPQEYGADLARAEAIIAECTQEPVNWFQKQNRTSFLCGRQQGSESLKRRLFARD
jgi:hypothetical protein